MASFATEVQRWYEAGGRTLPWRGTGDAYLVLVSEVMLQQTQVARVVPAFEAFIERFPDVVTLAAAPRSEVLVAWRGLGYNRRAVALHRAAQAVVEQHAGRIPDTLEQLRSLPGIGEYTARAVLAFAFDRDAAPVDTNIRRVLTRAVMGAPAAGRALQKAADAAVPPGRGRIWNEALMDLGATHCTSRPRCDACPMSAVCRWRALGGADPAAAGAPKPARPFAGSARFHRGRLLDALREGSVDRGGLAAAARVDHDAAAADVADGLVADGLAQWDGDRLHLPA